MADREQLEAAIKAAAWAYAAALGSTAAQQALERAKTELSNAQWGRR